jgi:DNA-binding CsgD family transcriptional regulator
MSQRSSAITGISPKNYEEIGLNYFFEQLHPEDRLIIIEKTLPLYKKALQECDAEERKNLNASLNYRIKPENAEQEAYRHVLSQLSIKSVNEKQMPVLLLGVFSQLKLEQYRGQDFKLYMNTEGNTTSVILDEHLTTNPLTSKEIEVLAKLSEGLSSKQIADNLFISKHTVDTHRRNILKKLDVQNSIEAVIYSRSMGWV